MGINYPRGSEWRKRDLHFHTPSSYDYEDMTVTDESIIGKFKENNISVAAITDHHKMDIKRIQKLQELGKKEGITILPGIELRSELGGSTSVHFIGIFGENSDLNDIWTKLSGRLALTESDVKKKGNDKIYVDLKDTAKIIKSLGGIVTIHAGTKTNSVESLKNKDAVKTDIVNSINIYELGKPEDKDAIYEAVVFPSIHKRFPLIICSDNHNMKKYQLKANLWIKADPNFEGLKQILYEPTERVSIQEERPQQKTGYEYIDHIDIDHEDIDNKTIFLHPNLTTIIGGRSSGKSLLMAILARKFNDTPAKKESKYNLYISELAQSTKIIWGTGDELPENSVDYFPQEAISELSRLDEYGELSKGLRAKIDDILDQKGLLTIKKQYQEFSFKNKLDIEANISELFKKRSSLKKIENDLITYSTRITIEKEISKLQKHINKISTLSAKDKKLFDQLKGQLDSKQSEKANLNNQKNLLRNYYIDYDVLSEAYFGVNEEYVKILTKKQNEINIYIKKTMKESIDVIIDSISKREKEIDNCIHKIKENSIYKKGMQNISDSQLLSDYEKKISIEKGKLGKRQELENQIRGHKKDIDSLQKLLIEKNKAFLFKANEFVKDIQEEKKDKLSISPYIRVKNLELTNYLQEKINQQSKENKEISNFSGTSSEIEARISEIFGKLLTDSGEELTLNGKDINKVESFCKGLLAENYLDIEFALTYDGVLFGEMSEGKRAFVILKLLLDFSEKTGPILIDQPEDDLDNRSISGELAEYLKEKKKHRQIIVVTHNANVVLGSDAELVIVANQHGEGTKNKNDSKFEYIQGSIEHTFELDGTIKEQLHKMGVREHICDILEGGEEAFEQRKKKYSFK